ncbi:hypothetical protein L3V82_05270 [Thiotrichales bacterium 19S3-7]|nr:hypothetical protein [Thiotrichales bacterium 19S3-7]MCF6801503.1 hypothetical protein [Thiotrichales bacterium 19S3-11]
MKMRKIKQNLVLILSVFCCPIAIYANSEYTMHVTNNADISIQISATNVKCMEQIEDEGGTYNIERYFQVNIAPGATYDLYLKDEDTGSCNGDPKSFDLVAKANLSSKGIEPMDGVDYQAYLTWVHQKNSGNWETKMYDYQNTHYKSAVLGYTNQLCKSGGGWIDCSDWIDGGSEFKVTVEQTNYEYQLESLNLGDVIVTDGLGEVIPVEPLTDSVNFLEGITYYVRFSKTQSYCNIRDELISCPSSIEFLSKNKDIVFVCGQTEVGNPACPWTTNGDAVDDFDLDYL